MGLEVQRRERARRDCSAVCEGARVRCVVVFVGVMWAYGSALFRGGERGEIGKLVEKRQKGIGGGMKEPENDGWR